MMEDADPGLSMGSQAIFPKEGVLDEVVEQDAVLGVQRPQRSYGKRPPTMVLPRTDDATLY
jgi:hypothetical protein